MVNLNFTKILYPLIPLLLNELFLRDEEDVSKKLKKLNEMLNKLKKSFSSNSIFETVQMIKRENPEISLGVIKKNVDKIHREKFEK